MPLTRRDARRSRWTALAPVLLAAYVSLLAAGPLDHHDVACHLKSTTHCTACVSASVPGTEAGPGVATCPLTFTNPLRIDREARIALDLAVKPGDRSPPSA